MLLSKYYTAFNSWISVIHELFISIKSTNDYVVSYNIARGKILEKYMELKDLPCIPLKGSWGFKSVLIKFPKSLIKDLQETHSSWLTSISAMATPFCFIWCIKSLSSREPVSIEMPLDAAAANLWLTLASSLIKIETELLELGHFCYSQ